MTTAVNHFWAEAQAIAGGRSASRTEPDGSIELFILTSRGTLEITGSGNLVSVACGSLFIEDQPVCTDEDAGFLLAVCDAVLNGEASVSGASPKVVLQTRGHSKVWTS